MAEAFCYIGDIVQCDVERERERERERDLHCNKLLTCGYDAILEVGITPQLYMTSTLHVRDLGLNGTNLTC